MFQNWIEQTRKKIPLVHTITNYVTVNDCANIVLAAGGSPIMADAIEEVEDIVSISAALVLNIGTLNAQTASAMLKAGKKANELGRPVILDPVGAGASKLRNDTVLTLLKEVKFAVIRGNVSEIKFIANGAASTKGVDADVDDTVSEENLDQMVSFVKQLSKKIGAVIAMTGAIDLVSDEKETFVIRNGHPMMAKITGTGCMLSCVVGSFVGANPEDPATATAYAIASYGICGELAFARMKSGEDGTGSYRTYLIDAMSNFDDDTFRKYAKVKCK